MELLIPVALAYAGKCLTKEKDARQVEQVRQNLEPSELPNSPFRVEEADQEARRLASEMYPDHLRVNGLGPNSFGTHEFRVGGFATGGSGIGQIPGYTMSSEDPVEIGNDDVDWASFRIRKGEKAWRGHNNMVPYYGAKIKQNTRDDAFQRKFEEFTGSFRDKTFVRTEVGPMFQAHRQNIFGVQSQPEENRKERFYGSEMRRNERPFEWVRVSPIEETDTSFRVVPKNIDETRVKTNPKITYAWRMSAPKTGTQMRGELGKIYKRKPPRSYEINEDYHVPEPTAFKRERQFPCIKETLKCNVGEFDISDQLGQVNSIQQKSYIPLRKKKKCKRKSK